MRLVVWNSCGAKWDTMWDYFIEPEVPPANDDLVIGLIAEAGWAPWIKSGQPVTAKEPYTVDEESDRYDEQAALKSSFCEAVRTVRGRHVFWIPWVKQYADLERGIRSNSRCSMGAMVVPRLSSVGESLIPGEIKRVVDKKLFIRPIVTIPFLKGKNVEVTVMLVHLVSGGHGVPATRELNRLMRKVPSLIPQSTMAIILGDFNINLLNGFPALPAGWRILAPHPTVATQARGGSLDWALIYNPNRTALTTQADVLQRYKNSVNQSDHSAIRYVINWRI